MRIMLGISMLFGIVKYGAQYGASGGTTVNVQPI